MSLQAGVAEWVRSFSGRPWVAVDEQTLGPQGSPRADVFAFNVSWSPQIARVYECKISASDLRKELTSGKWQKYLPHCNQYILAVTEELVTVARSMNLPPDVGLAALGKNGWRHLKLPKARKVDIPVKTWQAVAMRLGTGGAYGTPDIAEREARLRRFREIEIELRERKTSARELFRTLGQEVAHELRTLRDRLRWAEKDIEGAAQLRDQLRLAKSELAELRLLGPHAKESVADQLQRLSRLVRRMERETATNKGEKEKQAPGNIAQVGLEL